MTRTSGLDLSLADALPSLRERKTLAEEAADTLRELILLEKLPPGQQVPETSLATALGISRTPMREALRLLETEGLIEYTATRRPRVADPTLEELAQYLSVLGALEGLAGEQASARATEAETESIGMLCRTMERISDKGDPMEFFKTDMAFHRAIVAASRNPPLIETHRQYNARLWRARFISSRRRPDRPGTLRQHAEVHDALARRDGEACAAALRRHLQTTVKNIEKSRAESGRKETRR